MRRLKSMLLAALSIQAIGSLAAAPINSPNHSSCLSDLVYRPSKGVQTKSKRNRISQKKRRLNHRRKGK